MEKLKLEIRLLFGSEIDSADACIERMISLLKTKSGIESAHLSVSPTGQPGTVCIHFDPAVVSASEVRDAALKSGASLDATYVHLLRTGQAMHARRASAIEANLGRVGGVLEAVVSPDGTIRVEFDRRQTDEATIDQLRRSWTKGTEELKEHSLSSGANTTDHRSQDEMGHDHAHGGVFGEKTELIFAILCGILLLIGWLIETFTNLNEWIPLGLYISAYAFGGYYTFGRLRDGKSQAGN